MLLHVPGIHFGNISEEVSSRVERVFADASSLASESGELICHLGELHVSLRREFLEHHDGLIADFAPVLLVLVHLGLDVFVCDVKHLCKRKCIKLSYFPWSYHQVVCDPVAHEDIPVAVMDDATGRVDGGVYHRVVLCAELVFVLDDLYAEQLQDQDSRCCAQAYEKFVLPV